MLAQNGFLRDVDHDFSYVTPWAALYIRAARSRWPRPCAATTAAGGGCGARPDQLRDSLLAAHEQLAELEEQGTENRSELQAELDRRDEEILRLRDLLIGKDAELGADQGPAGAVEDRARRLAGAESTARVRHPRLRPADRGCSCACSGARGD